MCIFPLQKTKIDLSVCHKHNAIKNFDLSYAGIRLHFKQLYHLYNENTAVQHLNIQYVIGY